ncbi:MAG: type I-C CRISPR-associated protein Cas7/Csd2 [Synergistaceae bacterium]|jgi:CRISPR-associated protein Csd2|nr:type I-C CRISPR-associated protein Cas7/Csd2 [Synergistaceae bacterium]
MSLTNKIDFAVIFSVKNANPNGDPLNGNRPRVTYEGRGEVTDVCIKRKIRDRLLEKGYDIFVQSDDRKKDAAASLHARAEAFLGKDMGRPDTVKAACAKWYDVRAFGQVFAFASAKKSAKKNKKNSEEPANQEGDEKGVSIPVRGPVSIQSAFTPESVSVTSTQITKSVNSEDSKDGKKTSDTMGMKHRVDSGTYIFYGSMNPQLAERTGFSDQDAMALKDVLPKLFENDASSARPEGSMRVEKVFWWRHNCKSGQYSSAKVHGTVRLNPDGSCSENGFPDLPPEIIEGF